MADIQINSEVPELMAEIEEMFGRHYAGYAEKFPDNSKFWQTLQQEEIEHAEWLRQLSFKIQAKEVSLNEKRFDRNSLKEFQKHLKNLLNELARQSLTMKDALQNSLKIENLLLEAKFFEIFSADSSELKNVLNKLAEDTKKHRLRIEETLNQFR